MAILPYHVASLNIEATFAALSGRHEEFPNRCFVDTLDNVGLHTAAKGVSADLFGSMSEENVARIKQIYIAESTAQKTKLYDMYARFFRWASDRLDENGILAFVTNRSFIESRTFDGFRKTVAQEFADIYVVDLGGDVRANPRLSGTKHNVFGIQTGVAISFMVKRVGSSKDKKPARVHYLRRPELETAEEKLGFLANHPMRELDFDEVQPDKTGNWVNLTNNDFETLLPLASKETKAAKTTAGERAIFKLFSLGVVTNRDEWVYDERDENLSAKVHYLIEKYNADLLCHPTSEPAAYGTGIKWTRAVKADLQKGIRYTFDHTATIEACYRPFVKRRLYFHQKLNEMQYQLPSIFGCGDLKNRCLVITDATAQKPWMACAVEQIPDLHFVGAAAGTVCIPFQRVAQGEILADNITDWALKQFTAHYQAVIPAKAGIQSPEAASPTPMKKPLDSRLRGNDGQMTGNIRAITKEAIFHYCYAVLHNPVYREKYAQNLKREFPRIPLYGASLADFWRWAGWGEALMALHIGYETVAPFALTRTDTPDAKARAAGMTPKALLRADPAAGSITLDSETTLRGIPPDAWAYKLGNRSALDWVLDQYKEKKPKDPTIREKFDTYRFADYKDKVIDLLARVTTVSVETMKVVDAMKALSR